ncbi:MAG: nucleotidyltransferase domain-containing protein [Candidatus Bathyarchaeia archaeon]|jgi:predicted nucleotidyltransferase
MAKKPTRRSELRIVVYTGDRWLLLEQLRKKTLRIMESIEKTHVETLVHGSIARGDVSEKSDIDIFIPTQVSSFAVETALEKAGVPVNRRLVVQATPNYAMKANIEVDESTSVTFPLMRLRKVEREFYKFGGEANSDSVRKGLRTPGVDKRLMLIEPTEKGHRESTVVGREEQVAKTLGIGVETVLDRVHALIRRDEVGRTGVFIKQELVPSETFEMVLRRLVKENPAVRRRLKSHF